MKSRLLFSFIAIVLLISCARDIDTDGGQKTANAFFKSIISKDYEKAAKLVHRDAVFYTKRKEFIKHLGHDEKYGDLKSIGGTMLKAQNVTQTRDYTRWKFAEKLNYDSLSIIVDLTIVDSGEGPKFYDIKRRYD